MKLTKEQKSNVIFWGIFIALMAFLFLTPWGESTRAWLQGMTLSQPNPNSGKVSDKDEQFIEQDWQLKSTNGEEVWLSDFEKPVFINIWATWCPPCRSEMPSVISLKEKYKDRVDFILVSPDESIDKLKSFNQNKGYNTIFYNSISNIPYQLFSDSYPTTFILSKNKEIKYKLIGAHDWDNENVYKMLDEIIAE